MCFDVLMKRSLVYKSMVHFYFWWVHEPQRCFYYLFTSSMVDRGFDQQSGKTKDYKIGIFCICA